MNLDNRCQPLIRTSVILDMLKAKLGSDYKTSLTFGKGPSYVANIRSQGIVLNDEMGLKAAKLLDFPEEAILLSLAAERSLNSPSFKEISRLAEKYMPDELPPTDVPPSKHARKLGS